MTRFPYLEIFKALNSEAMLAVAALAALSWIWRRAPRRALMRRRPSAPWPHRPLGVGDSLCSSLAIRERLLLGGTLAVDDLILVFKLVIVALT